MIVSDPSTTDSSQSLEPRLVDLRWALVGGALTAVALFVGIWAVGSVGAFEALRLLESVLPTVRFLSSAVLAAAVTVLALMLTLLGLTYSSEFQFRDTHFRRIGQISAMATITIVIAVGMLLFLGIPLEAAEKLKTYYNIVYYAINAVASILAGMLVSTVLMLYQTIRGLVAIGHPEGESDLIEESPESQSPADASV